MQGDRGDARLARVTGNANLPERTDRKTLGAVSGGTVCPKSGAGASNGECEMIQGCEERA